MLFLFVQCNGLQFEKQKRNFLSKSSGAISPVGSDVCIPSVPESLQNISISDIFDEDIDFSDEEFTVPGSEPQQFS